MTAPDDLDATRARARGKAFRPLRTGEMPSDHSGNGPVAMTLGQFLRGRRRVLGAEPGAARAVKRRAPGLLREEVAARAAVSAGYYKRLEQGADTNPSRQILIAVARALELSGDETAYLFALAGYAHRRAVEPAIVTAEVERLTRLVCALEGQVVVLADPAFWIVSSTRLAQHVSVRLRPGRNWLLDHFLDPEARVELREWEEYARAAVGATRLVLAEQPDNERLERVVSVLLRDSAEFAALWGHYTVSDVTMIRRHLNHRAVGTIALDASALWSRAAPGHILWTLTPPPGSESEKRLASLRM